MAQSIALHSTEVSANAKVITVKSIFLEKGSGTNVVLKCDAVDSLCPWALYLNIHLRIEM